MLDEEKSPESVPPPASGSNLPPVIPKVTLPKPGQNPQPEAGDDLIPPLPVQPETVTLAQTTEIGEGTLPEQETIKQLPQPISTPPEPAHGSAKIEEISDEDDPIIEGIDWDEIAEKCKRAIGGSFDDFNPIEVIDGMEDLMSREGTLGMAFDEFRNGDVERQAVKVTALPPEDTDLWFVGDIHGDLLGMLGSLEYLKQASKIRRKTPWVIYLGDFFDRGAQGHEVMLTLFNHLLQDMARVCVIVGNHDESLQYSEESKKFHALVKPCEYSDWLNEPQDLRNNLGVRTGHLAIDLFRRMPRALFLPDGLLVAHGGVYHLDRNGKERGDWMPENEDDLNDRRCLQAFVWKRADKRAPRKLVNPGSSTAEYGYEDFSWFCELAAAVLNQPVERIVKGHEHHRERYYTYPEHSNHQMLCINNMCYSQGELGEFERTPCIARWINGGYPQVHRVRIPHQHILDIQGE